MYHYVREADPARPNFRYLDIDNFRRQLDHFETEYGFVTRAEWDRALETKDASCGDGKVLLTFDDAMSCHYNYVFPELVSRGPWGIFYVPAQPYLTGEILNVHRVHLLCGAFNGTDLLDLAKDAMTEEMVPFEKRQEFRENTYKAQKNAEGVSEFKRLINYFCEETHRTDVLERIESALGVKSPVKDFYVSQDDLLKMQAGGMILGSHTVTHPVMSKLTPIEQRREITTSFAFLDDLGRVGPKTYCHPYGGFHSFDAATVQTLEDSDVAWSFNVESRDISDADLRDAPQALPRYDCNEFPHGAAS